MDAAVQTSDTTLIFEGMTERGEMCLLRGFPYMTSASELRSNALAEEERIVGEVVS